MNDRPHYPWKEGDPLFADELNAAIANGGWTGGPFLPLTGGTLGNGTDTPRLVIDGASGVNMGIEFHTSGTTRFSAVMGTDQTWNLYGYDLGGTYNGQVLRADAVGRELLTDYRLHVNSYTSPPPAGVTGTMLSAHNLGPNTAYGTRVEYFSVASGDFDAGFGVACVYNPAFPAGPSSTSMQCILCAIDTPNDTTHSWGANVGEINLTNRGPDVGFKRDRGLPGNNTGGILFVPETHSVEGVGEGKNVGYGFAVSHSWQANSTGFPAKTYIAFNAEPNSVAGQTGRSFYASGDISGVASQYPYGPFQTEGTWLHGIDHTLAVYADTNATTMLAGQGVAWLTGTTGTPTNICRDTAGSGSPEGVVTANKGSTYRRFDGGAATCFYVKESGTGNTGWVAK